MFKRSLNLGVISTQIHFTDNRLFIGLFSVPLVIYDTMRSVESGITDSIWKSSLNIGLPNEMVFELASSTPSRLGR